VRKVAPGAALVVLVGALAACDVPRPPEPRLWTLFDVQSLYAHNAAATDPIADDAGLPGGIRLGRMMAPDGNLFRHPTLTEGYESRYLTTEVWANYDEVWAQPLYIPATYADGTRTPVPGDWIFSVGPGSLFYSPFWQVIYVEVDDKAAADALRSVRDVLNSGHPLHPGPGRTVSLVPAPVADKQADGAFPAAGTGWIDGQPVSYLDFGGATIEWDDDLVVKETPLYVPVYRTKKGELKRLGVTTIAAAGPRGSGGEGPPIVDDQARYAAYWRLYLVVIPPPGTQTIEPLTVFAPPGGTLATQLSEDGFAVPGEYGQKTLDAVAPPNGDALETYEGRVSTDAPGPSGLPPCFDDPDLLAATSEAGHCHWLGSQNAIEMYFDASEIIRTAVTVTCPVVEIRGVAVKAVGLK
jgi:hypothetical protein